ncbi:MAG: M48 family metalloprotease [Candidatus Bathyarchaeota archaeon]
MSKMNPSLYQSIKTTFNENLYLLVAICASSTLTSLGMNFKNYILLFAGVFSFSILVGVTTAYTAPDIIKNIWKHYVYHKKTVWMPMPIEVKKACNQLGLNYKKIKFGIRNDLFNAYTIGNSIIIGYPLMEVLDKEEQLGILVHELGHIKRRHLIKLQLILCIPYVFGTVCYLTLPELMRGITAVCMSLVMLIPIRWRFEKEADLITKKIVGIDVIVSAFNKMLSLSKLDDPSFSHPPISKRINALYLNS